MQAIRKQIHSALLNVSRLCEEFARKYPQYYPPLPIPHEGYSHLQYGNFLPGQSQFPTIHPNPWNPSNGQNSITQNIHNTQIRKEKYQNSRQQKISKKMRLQEGDMKKTVKQMKKQQKRLEQLKREQEKYQRQKIKLQSQKGKKKLRNTLKNQIKRDARFAQKPKFPMSPYFLFLKEMRTNNFEKNNTVQTSKQFAEQMGKAWREMSEQKKTPYITAYLKQKRIFDEKNAQFYEKYPDLKPRSNPKKGEHMYSVNDPKYQSETQAFDDQQLQADLIDELHSQEDGYSQVKQNGQIQDSPNEQQNEHKKHKDSLTLSDEKLTQQALNGNSPSQVVEID